MYKRQLRKRHAKEREDATRDWDAKLAATKVRSIHWSPYDRVGVVNADP